MSQLYTHAELARYSRQLFNVRDHSIIIGALSTAPDLITVEDARPYVAQYLSTDVGTVTPSTPTPPPTVEYVVVDPDAVKTVGDAPLWDGSAWVPGAAAGGGGSGSGTEGPPGPQGNQGPPGPQGPAGPSFTFAGAYSGSAAYSSPQAVIASDGNWYLATANVTGVDPVTETSGGTVVGAHWVKVPTGPTGPQGQPGIQGSPGVKGDKGDTGDQGIQGIQGIQGPPGVTVNATQALTITQLTADVSGTLLAFSADPTRRKWIIQNRGASAVMWASATPVDINNSSGEIPAGGAWVERDYNGAVYVLPRSGTCDCRRLTYN